MERVNIIATGSSGNATFIGDYGILIDCGVTRAALAPYFRGIQLVLLTHRHSDHFNAKTIAAIHSRRPSVRFGCGIFLVPSLLEIGVQPDRIDVLRPDHRYSYGEFDVEGFLLTHNVPNYGYRIHGADDSKLIYATDTGSLDGIEAKRYDYYLIEANHTEAEIHERIKRKQMEGVYSYEYDAAKNHLSLEKANDWLAENADEHSVIYYMHEHRERNTSC